MNTLNEINELHSLLNMWWRDFQKENPSADAAYTLLSATEGTVVHDHIALRTFDDRTVHIDTVMRPLVSAGYLCKSEYTFPTTHVVARHYEHHNGTLPKVFISQLEGRHFSNKFQSNLRHLLCQIPQGLPGQWSFFATARPWKVSFALYESLREESAYAAWVSAFGFRPTHFAIQINQFRQYSALKTLNSFLKNQGFELNDQKGEIQGSPDVFLEQSALQAAETAVEFSDGIQHIPGTYYEFARRYALSTGTLFNGFITESAESLFQSTESSSCSLYEKNIP